jgi:hypothetical protein
VGGGAAGPASSTVTEVQGPVAAPSRSAPELALWWHGGQRRGRIYFRKMAGGCGRRGGGRSSGGASGGACGHVWLHCDLGEEAETLTAALLYAGGWAARLTGQARHGPTKRRLGPVAALAHRAASRQPWLAEPDIGDMGRLAVRLCWAHLSVFLYLFHLEISSSLYFNS